ncbi:hypothetical protein [Microseira sp. BLCC-F43]|uniref:hypothetical protein n=1 Tax=Microseira sp. BLCC-F43 TaxID=3153602 RepID=UPI0035BADDB0
MTYNPFTNKFQIVKPPNPDSHYNLAVKILGGSVGESGKSARQSRAFSDRLSMIKVPSMFPLKIGNLWINLTAIRTLRVFTTNYESNLLVVIRWNNNCDNDDDSSYEEFEGEEAKALLAEWEKACDIILQSLSPVHPARSARLTHWRNSP